ncbi:hypothetical protein Ana3638_03470 [Anaerocolumna sedimenticola]|uniref:Polysaccharide pyruvyl transferase domain-containing protein n=1 Tax=Anaerocolumna sedimenticola TaxID=2696063 RepID=A0A6P1TJ64_9FIRM|nr:polysaccharide pyruvyl transferase family protein [Anaerocolumna sedimenticola]QHQ59956.1 hypothetical protein Ana3638_03470 [Anaerocolumna sedimenticola]
MKKIGIITITDNNLGNRLQNYALQEVIRNFGYEVETLQRGKKNSSLARHFKYLIKKILKKKDWKFRKFDKKIYWSPFSLAVQGDKDRIVENYDLFVAGSDQVWNPNFAGTNDDVFLTFASKEKRISYAASFGVSELPSNLLEKYENYMKGFKAISVREKQAVKIVEQFENCYAELVLDPTLLLSRDEWDKIIKAPKIKNKYVLKYLLGEDQSACNQMIKELFRDITVIDVKKLLSGGKNAIGPAEFLGFVKNAELICTDSFHASVFSTIFEKPFVIFDRTDKEKDMSSRIDSLCEMLSLQEHRYSSPDFDLSKVMHPDYKNTNISLEQEKNKSFFYLTDAIEN